MKCARCPRPAAYVVAFEPSCLRCLAAVLGDAFERKPTVLIGQVPEPEGAA